MTMPLHVLIIEDSEDDTRLIVRELDRGGYDVIFERVDTPSGLLDAFTRKWDLVICDYSMPYFSGGDALRALRSRGSDAPFIFVSGNIGGEVAIAFQQYGTAYVEKHELNCLLPTVRRQLTQKDRDLGKGTHTQNVGNKESKVSEESSRRGSCRTN